MSAADKKDIEELAASLNLSGVMDLCARLSIKNRGALMEKEKTASQRLLDLER